MATKEEITRQLKELGEAKRALGEELKKASSVYESNIPKLDKALTTKTITAIVHAMGGEVRLTLASNGKTMVVEVAKRGGGGGTKSPSRSRAAGVEDFIVNDKSIESAMPSKVIKAIGANYGKDSPERWLDKNVGKATAAKVAVVVDGKKIPVADFVKAYPAI